MHGRTTGRITRPQKYAICWALVGPMMGVSGDGGVGIVRSGVTSSVFSASSVGSWSAVVSDVGSVLVVFLGSNSALISWLGSRFVSPRLKSRCLMMGTSILTVFSSVLSRGASFCL